VEQRYRALVGIQLREALGLRHAYIETRLLEVEIGFRGADRRFSPLASRLDQPDEGADDAMEQSAQLWLERLHRTS
jgi:hypothetical protein